MSTDTQLRDLAERAEKLDDIAARLDNVLVRVDRIVAELDRRTNAEQKETAR